MNTTELNEWGFADAVDKQLKSNGKATFKMLPESKNGMFDLVVQDEEGNIYKIQGSEAQILFQHLLKDRNLDCTRDYSNMSITLYHKG